MRMTLSPTGTMLWRLWRLQMAGIGINQRKCPMPPNRMGVTLPWRRLMRFSVSGALRRLTDAFG